MASPEATCACNHSIRGSCRLSGLCGKSAEGARASPSSRIRRYWPLVTERLTAEIARLNPMVDRATPASSAIGENAPA